MRSSRVHMLQIISRYLQEKRPTLPPVTEHLTPSGPTFSLTGVLTALPSYLRAGFPSRLTGFRLPFRPSAPIRAENHLPAFRGYSLSHCQPHVLTFALFSCTRVCTPVSASVPHTSSPHPHPTEVFLRPKTQEPNPGPSSAEVE